LIHFLAIYHGYYRPHFLMTRENAQLDISFAQMREQ